MPSSPTTPSRNAPALSALTAPIIVTGRAEPGGGHGLVEALAAGVAHEGRAEHRLARVGHALEVDHEVLIEAADDDHAFTHVVDTLRCAGELVTTLGIDLGTGSVKAAVVDPDGTVRAKAGKAYAVESPRPGWAESDPRAWLAATHEVVAQAHRAARRPTAVGFSGQMHGVVVTDADLAPLRPAILWADGRATEQARALARDLSPGRAQPPRLAGGHRLRRDHARLAARARARRDGAGGARAAAEGLAARRASAGASPPTRAMPPARCCTTSSPATGPTGAMAWAGVDPALLPPVRGSVDRTGSIRIGDARPAERGRRRRHGLRARRPRAAARRRLRRGGQRRPGRARHGRSAARRHPAHPHLRHRRRPGRRLVPHRGRAERRACR